VGTDGVHILLIPYTVWDLCLPDMIKMYGTD